VNTTTTLKQDKTMTTRSNQFRSLREQALHQAGYYEDLFSPAMQTVVLETADEVYEDLLEECVELSRSSDSRLARSYRPSLSA
jgi:hypothetical protein